MNRERAGRLLLILILAAPAACNRPTQPAPPARVKTDLSPPPGKSELKAVDGTQAMGRPGQNPPPAKRYVMVCKNSRTGLPAQCGTPDAVMVGMKPE